jgi:hypothetical protein
MGGRWVYVYDTRASAAPFHARALMTAGVTGSKPLTRLVRRYAAGRIPDSVLHLISSARVVPVRKPNGKIRPIGIGHTLRRVVTKLILPSTIASYRDFLHLQNVATAFGVVRMHWCMRHLSFWNNTRTMMITSWCPLMRGTLSKCFSAEDARRCSRVCSELGPLE